MEKIYPRKLKKMGKLNYYEKYKGPEIDFILNGKFAFEVKIFPIQSDLKRLKKICEALKIKKYYLVSKNFVELENTIIGYDL